MIDFVIKCHSLKELCYYNSRNFRDELAVTFGKRCFMQSDWKEELVTLLQSEWQKVKKDGENEKNNEFLQIQEMLQRLEGKVDRLNARLTSLERESRRK